MTYPNKFDQVFFAQVKQAWDMGAVAVGATIYFGSPESTRQITEVNAAFKAAHELGLATILWRYTRNNAFKVGGLDSCAKSTLAVRLDPGQGALR